MGQATLHGFVHQVEPRPGQGRVRAALHPGRGKPQVLMEATDRQKRVGVCKEKIKK